MKKILLPLLAVISAVLLGGCAPSPAQEQDGGEALWKDIPFSGGQSYAVAHLGYQEIDQDCLDGLVEQYSLSGRFPVHYLSDGDFYLVIPRYSDTSMQLFQCWIETEERTLIFEEPDCRGFILQCNVSDIFPDAVIRLSHGEDWVEFSPFISLKDGSLDVGGGGLVLPGV